MKTKTTNATKATKAPEGTTVTIKARAATAIAADIIKALQDKESAQSNADTCYEESAQVLDGITPKWTLIKWNACKSPESTKAAFTAAGVTDSQGNQVADFLSPLRAAIVEFNPESWKTVAQSIRRWSVGYIGSKPNHPDVKPTATKKKTTATTTATTATTETPVRDLVHADPQKARMVLGELVAGFTTLKGACKKNKISTTLLQEVLDLLADTDAAIAALK
jgi:hypothetical protein